MVRLGVPNLRTPPSQTRAETADLPELDIDGDDPRGLGRAHGEAFADSIAANVTTYLDRFSAGGLGRDAALRLGDEWYRYIASCAPDYAVEMDGIAEGAGLGSDAIGMLNARYELAYGVLSGEAGRVLDAGTMDEVDGCTAFGLMPEMTEDGRILIGQNWDWLEKLLGRTLVMRVRRSNAPSFVGFTEAGIAGCKMGVNEAGIGLCVNGLVTSDDGLNGMQRPLHVRCRDVLNASRYDLAIGAVISGRRTCSSNILLGHADGEILNIEATPNHCAYIYPEDGLVTHANHLERESRVTSLFEQIAPHSLYRGSRLRRLLERRKGAINLGTLVDDLSDGFGRPTAICREPDPLLPEAKRVVTVASIVIDLAARVLHASAGPLTHNRLQRFPLEPS